MAARSIDTAPAISSPGPCSCSADRCVSTRS
jgi:hypothetical protein